MKITIDATTFKDAIKSISSIISEATLKITKDEMSLVAMDPANVAMVIFSMPSSAAIEWETIELKEGEVEKVTVNLVSLNGILRRTTKDDTLKLETTDNKLKIVISGYKDFSLPLIADDLKEENIPKLEHKSTVTLPTKKLADAIEDCSIAHDAVVFMLNKDKLVLTAEGDLKKAEITLNTEDVKIQTESEQKAKYAIEYLNKIVLPKETNIEVSLKTEYPLKLFYENKSYKLTFVLAPRVENA